MITRQHLFLGAVVVGVGLVGCSSDESSSTDSSRATPTTLAAVETEPTAETSAPATTGAGPDSTAPASPPADSSAASAAPDTSSTTPPAGGDSTGSTVSTGSTDPTVTTEGADLATQEFAVSWEDALATAQPSFDGDLRSLQLGWENGPFAYTIELLSDSEEYETRIGADTGDVVSEEIESIEGEDQAEKGTEKFDPTSVIAWNDALATAQQQVSDGRVVEWKLEGTSAGPQYEFDIGNVRDDVEVTIDATTGGVVETDD